MRRPEISEAELRAGFELARRVLATPRPRATRGHRVFCVAGRDVRHVDITPGEHAVFGSHECCDLRIPARDGIQTRHTFATSLELDDGALVARLLDLNTDVPLYLHGDEPHVSLVAGGPVAARLDRCIIGAIPFSALEVAPEDPCWSPGPVTRAERPPSAMPEAPPGPLPPVAFGPPPPGAPPAPPPILGRLSSAPAFVSSLPPPASVAAYSESPRPIEPRNAPAGPAAMPAPNAPARLVSGVASFAPAPFGPPAPPSATVPHAAPVTPGHVRISVERDGYGASVEVPLDALDFGVLVGRAEHCNAPRALRDVLNGNVSRVHLMLLRRAREVVAYDVCSMNGTYHRSAKRRSLPLPVGSTTELTLGQDVTLKWDPGDARDLSM